MQGQEKCFVETVPQHQALHTRSTVFIGDALLLYSLVIIFAFHFFSLLVAMPGAPSSDALAPSSVLVPDRS